MDRGSKNLPDKEGRHGSDGNEGDDGAGQARPLADENGGRVDMVRRQVHPLRQPVAALEPEVTAQGQGDLVQGQVWVSGPKEGSQLHVEADRHVGPTAAVRPQSCGGTPAIVTVAKVQVSPVRKTSLICLPKSLF